MSQGSGKVDKGHTGSTWKGLSPRLTWGLAWGLGWATIVNLIGSGPVLYRVESDAQQRLFHGRGPEPPAAEVVIVGIDGRVELPEERGEGLNPINLQWDQTADFLLDRANYAGLTLRLLEEAEARVVVLNLPSSFVVPQTLGNEDLDAPLRQIVQAYPDQLVLATRSSESFRKAEISIYNHFLPFSSLRLEYLVRPEHVQGVVQYQLDSAGILRQANLLGEFIRRDSQTAQIFASVEALALAKFDPDRASHLFQNQPKTLQFNPLGPSTQIPILPIEQICPPVPLNPCLEPTDSEILAQLRNKIVLVGFVKGYSETFPIRTAWGEPIAAVELQAQILSSMLTGQYYETLPLALRILLIGLVGLGTGVILTVGDQQLRWRDLPRQRFLLWPGVGLILYELWAIVCFLLGRQIWPLVLPGITVMFTSLSVVITRVLIQNRERLQAQQLELEQMQRAEREAAIEQARKLLYRVATDIHDRELQELKLAMDEIETLQWEQQEGISPKASSYDTLLRQLEGIGQGIRDQLNDVRMLASKLRISPSLEKGLHQGIETYLEELIAGGELTLPLQRDLHPLHETSTREWFDCREDIMRFVREAIANVISHVQPPKGTATYVSVSLTQTGSICRLEVINDGVELSPDRRGGYGTKVMNTIARHLPKGHWQRIHRSDGQIQVELSWEMPGLGTEQRSSPFDSLQP